MNTDVYKFSVVALSVADLLETECVNETCTVKQLRTQIGHHEQVCKYTENITCPSMFCDENLSVMNCIDHLKNSCTLGKCDHDWATMVFGTPRSIGLKNGSTNKGTWRYVPYVVSVMGDNIIMVGDNLGDLVLISFKCLSEDRSKRYSLELKLVDGKTGQSKNNQGQTLLMSETLEAGMEDGNVLELHSKTFKKYQGQNCNKNSINDGIRRGPEPGIGTGGYELGTGAVEILKSNIFMRGKPLRKVAALTRNFSYGVHTFSLKKLFVLVFLHL